jgi:hypothetical protein
LAGGDGWIAAWRMVEHLVRVQRGKNGCGNWVSNPCCFSHTTRFVT